MKKLMSCRNRIIVLVFLIITSLIISCITDDYHSSVGLIPGSDTCPNCLGSGICKSCNGTGLYNGSSCNVCKGTSRCIFCKGTGIYEGYKRK